MMKDTYTTRQGQTWDDIALEVYGAERHADYLMANNFSKLDILVFSSGMVLSIPELPEEQSGDLPPWRSVTSNTGSDPYD